MSHTEEPLNDYSTLWFGKAHIGKELKDVPASWLVWWYNANHKVAKGRFKLLADYIEARLPQLTAAAAMGFKH